MPKTQLYIVCKLESKLNILYSFMRSHLKSKMIVFLSSCSQVRFVYEAFCKFQPGVPLVALHGKIKAQKRAILYYSFVSVLTTFFDPRVFWSKHFSSSLCWSPSVFLSFFLSPIPSVCLSFVLKLFRFDCVLQVRRERNETSLGRKKDKQTGREKETQYLFLKLFRFDI